MTVDASETEDALAMGKLLTSTSPEFRALFNILERKGLITKAEFMEEVRRVLREAGLSPPDPDPYVVRG